LLLVSTDGVLSRSEVKSPLDVGVVTDVGGTADDGDDTAVDVDVAEFSPCEDGSGVDEVVTELVDAVDDDVVRLIRLSLLD
jgi:hypothetical protein